MCVREREREREMKAMTKIISTIIVPLLDSDLLQIRLSLKTWSVLFVLEFEPRLETMNLERRERG